MARVKREFTVSFEKFFILSLTHFPLLLGCMGIHDIHTYIHRTYNIGGVISWSEGDHREKEKFMLGSHYYW